VRSTSISAAPASIKDLENKPDKEVYDYCAPLWKQWDGIASLDTGGQQDTAARCFFYFGSALTNFSEQNGLEDTPPLKKFILFWKGFIESDPKVAAAAFKPPIVGALVGVDLCQKPSQVPAKARPRRTG
jgi:hypothetical protein